MRRFAVGMILCAIAGCAAVRQAAPAVARAVPAGAPDDHTLLSCAGATLRLEDDGASRTLELHCGPRDARLVAQGYDAYGSGTLTGPIHVLRRSEAEALWRAIATIRFGALSCDVAPRSSGADLGDAPSTGDLGDAPSTEHRVSLETARTLRHASCDHATDAWRALEAALRSAAHLPPDAPETQGEPAWPFGGDYWRDELGYYRRVATR